MSENSNKKTTLRAKKNKGEYCKIFIGKYIIFNDYLIGNKVKVRN